MHPKNFIGTRAGSTSRYAVLDIDINSKYHSKDQLNRLLLVLAKAGLTKSSLYRSSSSGGWHLYLFFEEHIKSAVLRQYLVKLLTLNDFEIAKGTLEVFPNKGDCSSGMGLRLPLQPGFAWLDKRDLDVEYERSELSATKALELFIDALESDANSYASFVQMKAHVMELESVRATTSTSNNRSNVVPLRRTANSFQTSEFAEYVTAVFGQLPPGLLVDNWYKGRLFHLNGLSGPSQRAEAITCVGHYLFYGDPSRQLPALGYGYEQERELALQKFLITRNNGQSKDINAGRTDAIEQVQRAANWRPVHKSQELPVKYSPRLKIVRMIANENRRMGARERIQFALDGLKTQQRAFTTVELQKAAHCSRETLYAHKDIWRAVYEDRKAYKDLSESFFVSCTGVYNVALESSESTSEPSVVASRMDVVSPPGLLAANRSIVKVEKNWWSKVLSLTTCSVNALTVAKLKSSIVSLTGLLAIAPHHEAQLDLCLFLSEFKAELSVRMRGPVGLVSDFSLFPTELLSADTS